MQTKNIDLKKEIEKIISDNSLEVIGDDCEVTDTIQLYSELERLSIIDFSVSEVQAGNDYHIQCDYYNKDIKKVIVLDYDFHTYYENIEGIISRIETVNKEIEELNRMTCRTLSKDMIEEIDTLVSYLYENDEDNHYEENDRPEGYIFESVRKVEDYLAKIKDVEIVTVEDTEVKEKNEITITVFKSETEEGYMYDIYDTTIDGISDGDSNVDSIDGGICTSNIINALGMAYSQAIDYLKK